MKSLFDDISIRTSRMVTHSYSTSFSLGIKLLAKPLRDPVYAVYGFVRLADEIVDSFHDYDKRSLLQEFCDETYRSIERRISVNPVLNAFQEVVHAYGIDHELIALFLRSMEMDLDDQEYDNSLYEQYISGSAEAVGLMCLKIFTQGNRGQYEQLKPAATRLGAAFQKVNFLRDFKADTEYLGRSYFPQLRSAAFNEQTKQEIEADIRADFEVAYEGIRQLPKEARLGVYVAYMYYVSLLKKIMKAGPHTIANERIRIPDNEKYMLFFGSYIRHSFNLI